MYVCMYVCTVCLLVVVLTVGEYGGQDHEADSHDDKQHHL